VPKRELTSTGLGKVYQSRDIWISPTKDIKEKVRAPARIEGEKKEVAENRDRAIVTAGRDFSRALFPCLFLTSQEGRPVKEAWSSAGTKKKEKKNGVELSKHRVIDLRKTVGPVLGP